jgi:RND family efflux transporter MFP subunit
MFPLQYRVVDVLKKTNVMPFALPISLLAVLALSVLSSHSRATPGDDRTLIPMSQAALARAGIVLAPVGTVPAATASAAGPVVLPGTVVPAAGAQSIASASVGGVVQHLHADTLQPLRAGAPVATLFSPAWMELQREYVQLASQARLARSKLARDEVLFADGIIAQARLDDSRAAAQLAALSLTQRAEGLRAGGMDRAAIAALATHSTLSPRLLVRAPADGVVVELPAAVGQQVEAGMPLARLVRRGALLVELQASERQLPLLAVGDRLQVAGCGELKVEAIGPAVESANQTARVRARPMAEYSCLKLNAYVEAHLRKPPVPAGGEVVPAAALVRRGSQSYVFVREPQGFRAVPVASGAAGPDLVWVEGPLPAGAQVAVRGLAALKGAWSGLGDDSGAQKGDK